MRLWILTAMMCCCIPGGAAVAQEVSDEEERQIAEFESSLNFRQGEVTLGDGLATIRVPAAFRYLDPDDAQRLLVEGWGNPPGPKPLGMLLPADASPFSVEGWGVIITFDEDGYIEDDEADGLDYGALLRDMQRSTKEENAEREAAGYAPIELVGWAAPPRYDQATHKLYWAKELRFGEAPENTLNYNVRILGRRGVLVLNAVAAMGQLAVVDEGMRSVIGFVDFNEGHRYADFVPGADRVAAYGLATLVAGKVAAKAGLFKVLIGFLVAAKKLVVVAVVAIVAFLGTLFRRRKERAETAA